MDDELIRRVEAAGHAKMLWREMLAEYRPELLEAWFEFTRRSFVNREINAKVRELIVVALDAAVDWRYTDVHVNRAFDEGATIQELVDVIGIAGAVMGPHATSAGMMALDSVIQRRRAEGLPVPLSRDDLA